MSCCKIETNAWLGIGLLAGILSGIWGHPGILAAAGIVSEIFIKLLKLISLPILFFALVSTLSSLDNWQELANLGKRILRYTLLTTYLAALIGLGFLLTLQPRVPPEGLENLTSVPAITQQSYWDFLWKLLPDNAVQAFAENNVLGVAFIGLLLGVAILHLEPAAKETCKNVFGSIFAAILKVAGFVIRLMPWGIWAFVTLLVETSIHQPQQLQQLMWYAVCVIGANCVQGFIVLPLLLKWKGIPVGHAFKGLMPALITAFFTKSSGATMPLTLECLRNRLGVDPKTANTAVPLCTVINMNGCAAFIVVTVLFVAMSHGIQFSGAELVLWTFMATLAAVGNAGVPMGCYFLTSAFLVSMNVPLTILGWILPLYMLIDMIETALNVWSDGCITLVVAKDSTAN